VIATGGLIIAALCLLYLRDQLPIGGIGAQPSGTPSPSLSAPPIKTVGFADPSRGCVVLGPGYRGAPGALYVTENGGRNWRRASVPAADVGGVEVVDRQHLATFPSSGSRIWTSEDFGRTWRSAHLPIPSDEASLRPVTLSFVDARHAWILLEPGDPRGPLHPFQLWWTDDSGQHWRQVAAAGLPQDIAVRPVFLDTHRGAAVVSRDAAGHGEDSILYLTEDGGQTWRQGRLPAVPPLDANGGSQGAILFSSGDRLVLLNGLGAGVTLLATSDDGGQTWGTFTRVPAAASASIMVGGGRLASLAGGRVWTSNDSGKHWQSRSADLPARLFVPTLVVVVPGALFVEAGRASPALPDTLFRSRDDGAHWDRMHLPQVASR
jgi:photosystem II stability/assembly factor-like uncharacterized protein